RKLTALIYVNTRLRSPMPCGKRRGAKQKRYASNSLGEHLQCLTLRSANARFQEASAAAASISTIGASMPLGPRPLLHDLDPQPLDALEHVAVRRGNVAAHEHMSAAEVKTAQRRQQQPARAGGQRQARQGRHQDGVAAVYGLDGALALPQHVGRRRRGLRVVLNKHLHEEPVTARFLKSAALPAGAIR